MIETGKDIVWVLASYLLGCITFGYYLVRWRTGEDVRRTGSGHVGARNVGRALGRTGFFATLILDLAKGAFAVEMARWFGLHPDMVVASLIAVIVGHNWPMQLRFQGGKGVAVSLGAFLAYDYFVLLILASLFLPFWAITKRFNLSGMLAYSLAPLMVFLCGMGARETCAMSVAAMLVVLAHRKNIREDLAGLVIDRPSKASSRHTSARRSS